MSLKREVRQRLVAAIRDGLAGDFSVGEIEIDYPEREEFGDLATNLAMKLFGVAKGGVEGGKGRGVSDKWGASSREAAQNIARLIAADELIEKVEVAGPGFINMWVRTSALIKECQRVITEGENYGRQKIGEGKTVVVDYSSPNIAKRFGIGHLRSTIIGQAIYNLYAFLGYRTIGDNHLGDWGTQFGVLIRQIVARGLQTAQLDIDTLERLYVEFHQQAKENPRLGDEARAWFKKLEEKDPIALDIWKRCVDVSIEEFARIYQLLGVSIDYSYGESFYEDLMRIVIDEARAKNLTKISEGAEVMELPGVEVPLMFLKSDGATTYATRDLATLKFRKEQWDPAIIVYEVGNEQSLHFQQVFAAARRLGYVGDDVELVHTRHGLYLNPDGKKFSTRKGDTVRLEEVLDEAIERARALGCGEEEVARQVGVGAIKYFDLSHSPQSDIVFAWDKVMALEGNSGPYLQYTAARINSLLKRGEFTAAGCQFLADGQFFELGITSEERRVLGYVHRFPEAVEAAAARFSPNLLANFLYELASRYNAFYNQQPVLTADSSEAKEFRLLLSAATGQVLKNGLRLLGIESPERM